MGVHLRDERVLAFWEPPGRIAVVFQNPDLLPNARRRKPKRVVGLKICESYKWPSMAVRVPRLAMLLEEFFAQHVDGELARKTAERYHDQAAYLDPALRSEALAEITPLRLRMEVAVGIRRA